MTNLWTLQAHRAKHIENQSFFGKKQLRFCQKILRFWAAEKGFGTQERGKGKRKTRGQKRGKTGDFGGKWRPENEKHRTSPVESAVVCDGEVRCFVQRSPVFWGFRRVISGVFTPSHPQFFRICRKKMYISAIQRWGNIHEIIK